MASPKGPGWPGPPHGLGSPRVMHARAPMIFSRDGLKYVKGQESLFTGPLHAQKRDSIPAQGKSDDGATCAWFAINGTDNEHYNSLTLHCGDCQHHRSYKQKVLSLLLLFRKRFLGVF